LFRQKLMLASGTAAGLLVAACSTAIKAPVEPHKPLIATAPSPAIIERAVTTPRPGAYYLDDGPPDVVPVDLAKVRDATPQIEELHRFANKPYQVMGESYVPVRDYKPYQARGVASWYGKKFHGRKTSSGEIYDMFAMTAAHPTLPIPSYARVINPANGKSVVVKINDRGPFHKGRIMDLSYAAAHRLGYASRGSATVEVESITPEQIAEFKRSGKWAAQQTEPVPASEGVQTAAAMTHALNETTLSSVEPEPVAAEKGMPDVASLPVAGGKGVFLQIGAFRNKDNAEGLKSRLTSSAGALPGDVSVVSREGLFRIHVGPYDSEQSARLAASQLRGNLSLNAVLVR